MTSKLDDKELKTDYGKKASSQWAVPAENDLSHYKFRKQSTYVVRFLNPTSNKALHMGHLRNASVGMAIAGSLSVAGARAIRHCVVEDTGRFMMEALAGFNAMTPEDTPPGLRLKCDHVVGWYYRQYRGLNAKNKSGKRGAARLDAADELMRRWLAGDAATRNLWRQLKTLALLGQQETLRRLGITLDFCDFESAEDDHTGDFLREGLLSETFVAESDGQVSYLGGAGQKRVEMVDRAGLPVENLRLLTFLNRLYRGWPRRWVNIIVAGNEWRASMSQYPAILRAFGLSRSDEIYIPVFIGMVTQGGRKVASRSGHGVLVDDLLDEVRASRAALDIHQASDMRLPLDEIASIVSRCYLLSVPRRQPVELSRKAILDEARNPGWEIARCRAEMMETSARTVVPPAELTGGLGRVCEEALDSALRTLSFEQVVLSLRRVSEQWRKRRDDRGGRAAARAADTLIRCLGLERDSTLDVLKLRPLTRYNPNHPYKPQEVPRREANSPAYL
ncbi:MAG TPA: arginine--tRNA ligase [Pyrinomonadaceae bacterium]|jgi:arginyl-tRNA synthetase